MNYTIPDKIAVVEHLIESFRWARDRHTEAEERTYSVLKAIANEYRGRLPGAPSKTLKVLERRMKAVRSTPGYSPELCAGLGMEVVGHWSTIRQALEQFEAAVREAAE